MALLWLWLATRGVDLGQVAKVLMGASPWYVLLAGVLSCAINCSKCLKLGILLRAVKQIPYLTLFCAETISVLVDVAFPFRLQELVKAYVVGRREGLRPSLVLGAEVVEKGVEAIFLLFAMLLLGLMWGLPPWLERTLWGGFGGLALVLAFFTLVIARPTRLQLPLARIRDRSGGITGRLCDSILQLLEGIRAAAVRPSMLLWVLALTLVDWLLLAGSLVAAAAAIGLRLGPGQQLALLVANFIAFALPTSSAGSVGIYELAGKTVLVALFGMDPEVSLALVLVFHAVMVGFGALCGLLGLALSHLSISDLRQQLDGHQEPSPGEDPRP